MKTSTKKGGSLSPSRAEGWRFIGTIPMMRFVCHFHLLIVMIFCSQQPEKLGRKSQKLVYTLPYFSLWTTIMGEIQIIHFTQDQVRTLTGVSSETLRHWRKHIGYLAEKSGKAARFSFSDLICIASTIQIIEFFGVSISNIAPVIDSLFRKLGESRFAITQHHILFITKSEAIVCEVDEVANMDFSHPMIMIPLGELITNLRQSLLPGFPIEQQMQVPFMPQSIAG